MNQDDCRINPSILRINREALTAEWKNLYSGLPQGKVQVLATDVIEAVNALKTDPPRTVSLEEWLRTGWGPLSAFTQSQIPEEERVVMFGNPAVPTPEGIIVVDGEDSDDGDTPVIVEGLG